MGTPVFPGSVKTFTTKQDGIDTVVAAHVNTLQDEVVALQSQVGVSSELPSLNLPSTSGTGAAVANRVSPQISGLKQWADHLNTYKAPLLSPTFTGTVTLPATTTIGSISQTELGYLDGVTSSIQSQLNGKVSTSGDQTMLGNLTLAQSLTVGNSIIRAGTLGIHANGGQLEVWSNGSLTTVACADGIYGNQAVTRAQYDYLWTLSQSSFLSPNEQFYGSLRTLDGTFYQMHTNASDKKSVVNIEHLNAVLSDYLTIAGSNNLWNWHNSFVHSSRELKNDIADFPVVTGASLFDVINPVTFKYKSHEEDDRIPAWVASDETRIGFIAEDLRDAGVPIIDLPNGAGQSTLGLALPDLIAVLWSKVKEQEQRIFDLEMAAK